MKQKNTKSIIAMALAVFMVVSMLSVASTVQAAPGDATLSLVSSTNINLTYPQVLPIGSTFTVMVNVADVTDLWAVNIGMTWNPAVVKVNEVAGGSFLGASVLSPTTPIDNVAGTLPAGFSSARLVSSGVSGAGNLMVVTFEVVGFGSGNIAVSSVQLKSAAAGHPLMAYNALPSIPLNNPTPPPYGPTAAFTVSATPATVSGTYITIPSSASSTTIVLDASSSTGGFTGSASAPITSWSWKVNGVVVATTQTDTLTTVTAGDLTVELTVGATGAVPETNTITVVYHVLQAASTGIDVTTQQGGTGANVPSGPFGPQQQIVSYAKVISNGAPVAQKDVIFAVYTNNGAQYAYQVARTNATGYATVSFRLPTYDTSLDSGFGGNWTIVATVDISEQQYTDSAKFTFNYLANIASVTATPSTVVRGSGSVSITVTTSTLSGAVISPNALVTITVVDSNNVPIAATTSPFSSSVTASLAIPNYAFTGGANVYVNILSNQPTLSGTPYCPQNGAVVTFGPTGLFQSSVQNAPAQFQISYVA